MKEASNPFPALELLTAGVGLVDDLVYLGRHWFTRFYGVQLDRLHAESARLPVR